MQQLYPPCCLAELQSPTRLNSPSASVQRLSCVAGAAMPRPWTLSCVLDFPLNFGLPSHLYICARSLRWKVSSNMRQTEIGLQAFQCPMHRKGRRTGDTGSPVRSDVSMQRRKASDEGEACPSSEPMCYRKTAMCEGSVCDVGRGRAVTAMARRGLLFAEGRSLSIRQCTAN